MRKTEEQKEKNRKRNGILLLVCVGLMFIGWLFGEKTRKRINENARIGIFYVDDIRHGKGIPAVDYHYYENGNIKNDSYTCSSTIINNVKIGGRYFGKYIPNTNDSFICCGCKVPSDIKNEPNGGWSELPKEFCLNEEDLCWTN